jgi:hypothetical protein
VFVVNARGQDALLKNDPLELVNTQCLPGAQCVNGIARLGQDIGCVINCLDAALGGHRFTPEPPTATFQTEEN